MRKKLKVMLGAICCVAISAISLMGVQGSKTVQAAEVAIDENNFPDEVFRNYVKTNIDTDKNNMLSDDEINATKKISISMLLGNRMSSLDGIGYFTSLTRLVCDNHQLTELDLSKNTKATVTFQCNENGKKVKFALTVTQ